MYMSGDISCAAKGFLSSLLLYNYGYIFESRRRQALLFVIRDLLFSMKLQCLKTCIVM